MKIYSNNYFLTTLKPFKQITMHIIIFTVILLNAINGLSQPAKNENRQPNYVQSISEYNEAKEFFNTSAILLPGSKFQSVTEKKQGNKLLNNIYNNNHPLLYLCAGRLALAGQNNEPRDYPGLNTAIANIEIKDTRSSPGIDIDGMFYITNMEINFHYSISPAFNCMQPGEADAEDKMQFLGVRRGLQVNNLNFSCEINQRLPCLFQVLHDRIVMLCQSFFINKSEVNEISKKSMGNDYRARLILTKKTVGYRAYIIALKDTEMLTIYGADEEKIVESCKYKNAKFGRSSGRIYFYSNSANGVAFKRNPRELIASVLRTSDKYLVLRSYSFQPVAKDIFAKLLPFRTKIQLVPQLNHTKYPGSVTTSWV